MRRLSVSTLVISVLLLFGLVLLTSCSGPGSSGGSTGSGSGSSAGGSSSSSSVVTISTDVTSPTTWAGGKVYVIDNIVNVTSTLTIDPGAIIKITAGNELDVSGTGTLNAVGTSTSPIVFTSYKDDAHGGDTNGDGTASSPSAGDWDGVSIAGNGSTCTYCEFYYSGGSYNYALSILGNNETVTYSTFGHNAGVSPTGITGALDAYSSGTGVTINNDTFYDNKTPMTVSGNINLDDTNVFSVTNEPGNTYPAIVEDGDVTGNITWAETKVAIVLVNITNITGTLTLGSNTILKITNGNEIDYTSGSSTFNYNSTNIMTSYKDDSVPSPLGDTNGDGSASSPSAGDWNGLWDLNTGTKISASNILYD